MKNIKVLNIYKRSLPSSTGGVEFFIGELCRETGKLGVDNLVMSLSKTPESGQILMDGYHVQEFKENLYVASTGFSISAFINFRALASEADILHYHFPNPFMDLMHVFWRPKKPTLVTYHSDIIKQTFLLKLYKPLMRVFLRSMDRVISTSPNYFSTSDVLATVAQKTEVIPIGINPCPKLDVDVTKDMQKALPSKFFLFVGVLRYYKGLHLALQAVEGTTHNLVIAGTGGIERELKTYVSKRNMKNVIFLGEVTEQQKFALLSSCYGFVFPSNLRAEAFGIALLEAAVFGKPLISSEIGSGTSFVNMHLETGFVVPPSSVVHLRDAMNKLADQPLMAAKMGENARARCLKFFTLKQQAARYAQVYEELLYFASRNASSVLLMIVCDQLTFDQTLTKLF